MFFFTNNIALHLIENPHLVRACAALGVTLPSRKKLATLYLEEAYNSVKAATVAWCRCAGNLAVLATDGWRSRLAASGTPLLNVIKLLPTRAIFCKVIPASGVVKDADWITETHIQLANDVFDGQPDNWVGFLMDNTKANRKAMVQLRQHNPK
ncbi:hypothetical protein Agub_g4172, partial [Astrephomene gubernaculifera]